MVCGGDCHENFTLQNFLAMTDYLHLIYLAMTNGYFLNCHESLRESHNDSLWCADCHDFAFTKSHNDKVRGLL